MSCRNVPTAIVLPPDFDPHLTLCGGQAFRWTPIPTAGPTTAYLGVVGDTVLALTRTVNGQWQAQPCNHPLTAACRRQISTYFDLDRDYAAAHRLVVERLARFSRQTAAAGDDGCVTAFQAALHNLSGLRILRQPWFETLVSFVIATNNHLPRIRAIINVISRKFGRHLGNHCYTFPTPDTLAAADPGELRTECRVGYRDRYLPHLARHILHNRSFWQHAAAVPTSELRAALRNLPGVGPKVAECVLLFGFHRWEAFPVDVWVYRALTLLSGRPLAKPATHRLAADAAAFFGPVAGLAQQYLFEGMRRFTPPNRSGDPPRRRALCHNRKSSLGRADGV